MEEKKNKGGGVDRLSDLPDHILLPILSFLHDTKEAVRTSVLSKRWRFLWRLCPNIYLDGRGRGNPVEFERFVTHFIARCSDDSKLEEFGFYCGSQTSRSLINEAMDYVTSRNVDHLIVGTQISYYSLPDSVFKCQSLKTLTLKGAELGFSIKSFSFPTLCTLNILSCQINCDDGPVESCDLFANCPNLNNLWVDACYFEGFGILKISAPQLLSLTLSKMYDYVDNKVELSAPKLTSFSYIVSEIIDFSAINLPSLQSAIIDVKVRRRRDESLEERKQRVCPRLHKLLQGLRSIQFATLHLETIYYLNVIPRILGQPPSPLSRLKSVALKVRPHFQDFEIPENLKQYLLSGSPSLEIMVV